MSIDSTTSTRSLCCYAPDDPPLGSSQLGGDLRTDMGDGLLELVGKKGEDVVLAAVIVVAVAHFCVCIIELGQVVS